MKKILIISLAGIASLCMISWGVAGHKTIAQIAENHLTPQSKNAVRSLLGNQSLADVSTWADEARNTSEYRSTARWHFLNLPAGLNFKDFVQAVKTLNDENIYTAILKCQQTLTEVNATADQKTIALKFIIHFVGDLHQPMHISRAEDKGGNTIQVRYDSKGTNLHSLWDSKLLEHQGTEYNQLATNCDVATAKEIKQWQADDMLVWIFESYQISSRLYAEIESNTNIDDQYYNLHLPIIQQRLKKGGIRLAGILNSAFKSFNATPQKLSSSIINQTNAVISINDINNHIGEQVNVCSKMYGFKSLENMTLVNFGAAYPNQLLTVVLRGAALEDYKNFGSKNICVAVKIIEYRGKPEIIVTEHNQIKISN